MALGLAARGAEERRHQQALQGCARESRPRPAGTDDDHSARRRRGGATVRLRPRDPLHANIEHLRALIKLNGDPARGPAVCMFKYAPHAPTLNRLRSIQGILRFAQGVGPCPAQGSPGGGPRPSKNRYHTVKAILATGLDREPLPRRRGAPGASRGRSPSFPSADLRPRSSSLIPTVKGLAVGEGRDNARPRNRRLLSPSDRQSVIPAYLLIDPVPDKRFDGSRGVGRGRTVSVTTGEPCSPSLASFLATFRAAPRQAACS